MSGIPSSTYHYNKGREPKQARPELRAKVAEIFSRTRNGCGHSVNVNTLFISG